MRLTCTRPEDDDWFKGLDRLFVAKTTRLHRQRGSNTQSNSTGLKIKVSFNSITFKCLVDIGDKPSSFVGSKKWIGSTELSFCLETMFGLSSKILTTNSGAEIGKYPPYITASSSFRTTCSPTLVSFWKLRRTCNDWRRNAGSHHSGCWLQHKDRRLSLLDSGSSLYRRWKFDRYFNRRLVWMEGLKFLEQDRFL